jgi:glucose-6-phosphate isomerase
MADLVVPVLSEHTVGQLLQLFMLATVVEGRLMGINPYGQPSLEAYERQLREQLLQEPMVVDKAPHA